MLLLLLIIPVWTIGLMIVAGLCFAARVGDGNLQSEVAEQRAKLAPARQRDRRGSIERGHQAEPRELVA